MVLILGDNEIAHPLPPLIHSQFLSWFPGSVHSPVLVGGDHMALRWSEEGAQRKDLVLGVRRTLWDVRKQGGVAQPAKVPGVAQDRKLPGH